MYIVIYLYRYALFKWICSYFTTQTATNGQKYPQCWSKIPKVLMSIFTNPKHVLKIRPRSTDDCKDSKNVRKSHKIRSFSVTGSVWV